MRYFYHPESDCLWEQEGPLEDTDGLVEEIDRETYDRLLHEKHGDLA